MQELLKRYPALTPLASDLEKAADLLISCFSSGGKLLLCGNGGSAADCEHIAGELMKGFLLRRELTPEEKKSLLQQNAPELAETLHRALPCVCLTGHPALSTAVGNDMPGNLAFAQQAWALCRPGDVLLGISTSGNAQNVLQAAQAVRARGGKVLGMTGATGGKLKTLCDAAICAPETETFKVQEYHLPIYHWLCMRLEAHFFG